MNEQLQKDLSEFNAYLKQIYETWPLHEQLKAAVNYSLLAKGKRVRPLLFFSVLHSFGNLAVNTYFPAAAALEMIHNYSLIHDDLPAMDNDEFRRNQLTNHIVFGEDIAILAGDALLTDAFRILMQTPVATDQLVQLVKALTAAAGSENLITGQVEDLKMTTKSATQITLMDQHKTAALFVAASELGAICLRLAPKTTAYLKKFAEKFGLAFQLADDLQDLKKENAEIKNYAADFGISATQKSKEQDLAQALAALEQITDPNFNSKLLKSFARQIE